MKTTINTRPDTTLPALILTLAAAGSTIAADLKVPGDFPTIQAAADAAQTDDTIHIAPGVYTTQVEIVSKKLTVLGHPGTILRATVEMTPVAGAGVLLFARALLGPPTPRLSRPPLSITWSMCAWQDARSQTIT
jgi:pectin methylesterase-like acyl-CoA thioesterase